MQYNINGERHRDYYIASEESVIYKESGDGNQYVPVRGYAFLEHFSARIVFPTELGQGEPGLGPILSMNTAAEGEEPNGHFTPHYSVKGTAIAKLYDTSFPEDSLIDGITIHKHNPTPGEHGTGDDTTERPFRIRLSYYTLEPVSSIYGGQPATLLSKYQVYDMDLSGEDPENHVIGERWHINTSAGRQIISPMAGAFYGHDVVVRFIAKDEQGNHTWAFHPDSPKYTATFVSGEDYLTVSDDMGAILPMIKKGMAVENIPGIPKGVRVSNVEPETNRIYLTRVVTHTEDVGKNVTVDFAPAGYTGTEGVDYEIIGYNQMAVEVASHKSGVYNYIAILEDGYVGEIQIDYRAFGGEVSANAFAALRRSMGNILYGKMRDEVPPPQISAYATFPIKTSIYDNEESGEHQLHRDTIMFKVYTTGGGSDGINSNGSGAAGGTAIKTFTRRAGDPDKLTFTAGGIQGNSAVTYNEHIVTGNGASGIRNGVGAAYGGDLNFSGGHGGYSGSTSDYKKHLSTNCGAEPLVWVSGSSLGAAPGTIGGSSYWGNSPAWGGGGEATGGAGSTSSPDGARGVVVIEEFGVVDSFSGNPYPLTYISRYYTLDQINSFIINRAYGVVWNDDTDGESNFIGTDITTDSVESVWADTAGVNLLGDIFPIEVPSGVEYTEINLRISNFKNTGLVDTYPGLTGTVNLRIDWGSHKLLCTVLAGADSDSGIVEQYCVKDENEWATMLIANEVYSLNRERGPVSIPTTKIQIGDRTIHKMPCPFLHTTDDRASYQIVGDIKHYNPQEQTGATGGHGVTLASIFGFEDSEELNVLRAFTVRRTYGYALPAGVNHITDMSNSTAEWNVWADNDSDANTLNDLFPIEIPPQVQFTELRIYFSSYAGQTNDADSNASSHTGVVILKADWKNEKCVCTVMASPNVADGIVAVYNGELPSAGTVLTVEQSSGEHTDLQLKVGQNQIQTIPIPFLDTTDKHLGTYQITGSLTHYALEDVDAEETVDISNISTDQISLEPQIEVEQDGENLQFRFRQRKIRFEFGSDKVLTPAAGDWDEWVTMPAKLHNGG